MNTQLVPPWAPNVHPLLVHFPIVLVLLALLIDLAQLIGRQPGWGRYASLTFVLGAVGATAAYLSGRSAESTVFIPGMAHGLVNDHAHWALTATTSFVAVAALRVAGHFLGMDRRRGWAIACVVGSVLVAGIVQQTAERGARLVFEQGVGVSASPGQGSGP